MEKVNDSPGEIWAINVAKWEPSIEDFERVRQTLQREEKDRVNRFRFMKDKKRSLVGRLLLRKMAKEASGHGADAADTDIQFQRTGERKPYVVRHPDDKFPKLFNINLSHHGNWVVCSTHNFFLVGTDVMNYESPRGESILNFLDTFDSSFTRVEWEQIKRPEDDGAKLRQFYRFWALKESYIKAVGIGLGMELKNLEFFCETDGAVASLKVKGVHQDRWKFHLYDVDEEHVIVVAYGPTIDAIGGLRTAMREAFSSDREFRECEATAATYSPQRVEVMVKTLVDVLPP